jgi:thiosulfate/3-mercaptopyruvate sulfurtransferase
MFDEITTTELTRLISDKNVRIIDVRPVDAYNGWRMEGEVRGGHIKNAKSLPVKWTNYIDWIEIVRAKKILPEHKIIIYSYHRDDSIAVAKLFKKANYIDVSFYNSFLDEWTVDDDLPMEYLKRYRQLVPASWVKEIVDGRTPQEFESGRTVIVHSHYRNRDAYLSGHIPGAIDMDTLALESSETWNRRPPEEIKSALEQH